MIAVILGGTPSRARCHDDPEPLAIFVERQDSGATAEEIRQAVSSHLGVPVVLVPSTAVTDGTRRTLHVDLVSGDCVRIALHRVDDSPVERVVPIDDGSDPLHVIVLMAENLVRDQVSTLLEEGVGRPEETVEAESSPVPSSAAGEQPAPQTEGRESAPPDERPILRQPSDHEPSSLGGGLELTALAGWSMGVHGWRVEAQASYRGGAFGVGLSAVGSRPVSSATDDGSRLALGVVGDYRMEVGIVFAELGMALGLATYVIDDGAYITQTRLQGRILLTGGVALTDWLAVVVRTDFTAGLLALDQAEVGGTGYTSRPDEIPFETAAVLGLRAAML
jgi:hypothetical protein